MSQPKFRRPKDVPRWVAVSTSCPVMRTRFAALRTLPSNTYCRAGRHQHLGRRASANSWHGRCNVRGFGFAILEEYRRTDAGLARPIRSRRASRADRWPVDGTLALPNKPSIAVLPFTNLSSDPEQEYFADGMVDEIITALSRFKALFVIARNSSFTYKGRAVDVKQVGRELGVR